MPPDNKLSQSLKDYETLRQHLITAVGEGVDRQEIDHIKRQLETIASQIHKLDMNRKL